MRDLGELIVEVSNNCNLSCKMCGFGQQPFDKERFMNSNLFKKVIDELGECGKCIRLNGRGESTIHPEFVQMLEYTRNKCPKSKINLFTNFSFNSEIILKSLIKNDVQLFLSVDSPIKHELEAIRRGCKYEWIFENISSLPKLKYRPFIVFTIMEDNLHRIYDIGKFAFDHNLGIIYNTVRRDEGIEEFIGKVTLNLEKLKIEFGAVKSLFELSELSYFIPDQIAGVHLESESNNYTETFGQKKTCPALYLEVCILYNEDVTPCNMFNPYVYGNITNDSFEDIMNGKKRKEFLTSHKNHYYCKNCACLGDTG
jgi:MoaA/NifB/PqqE/SkfB family radical SAM enzyme